MAHSKVAHAKKLRFQRGFEERTRGAHGYAGEKEPCRLDANSMSTGVVKCRGSNFVSLLIARSVGS